MTASIFLAGPTPRDRSVRSWRPEALELLRDFEGTVFVPEPRDQEFRADYLEQIDWELEALRRADCILFWVPRDLETLPGFTTNVEIGYWLRSGKIVFGAPPDAPKTKYLRAAAEREQVPRAETLADTVALALARVGPGAERRDGECQVPLHIFRSPAFRCWYEPHKRAGNILKSAREEWALRAGPKKDWVILFVLHVEVFVAAENRTKKNEVIIARPDVGAVILHRKNEIALVREFRAPVSNEACFVREPPSGSSEDGGKDMKQVALDEVREEAGLVLAPERLREVGSRQLAATMSTHRAHVYAVELTEAELERFKAEAGVTRGADEGECTHVEIWTIDELLRRDLTDWSTLGMILAALERTP